MIQITSENQHVTKGTIVLLSNPLYGFVKHLESNCVYDCCGMDAFDFSASNALAWVSAATPDECRHCAAQLKEINTAINEAELPVYISVLGMLDYGEANEFFYNVENALLTALETHASNVA